MGLVRSEFKEQNRRLYNYKRRPILKVFYFTLASTLNLISISVLRSYRYRCTKVVDMCVVRFTLVPTLRISQSVGTVEATFRRAINVQHVSNISAAGSRPR